MILNITVVAGDGIGPEVTDQGLLVLEAVASRFGHQTQLQHKLIGGAALSAVNDPLPAETIAACRASSAVLLGAVGSPAFDKNPGICGPRPACYGSGGSWVRTRICVRQCFSRHWRIALRCGRKLRAGRTS